MGRYPGRVVIFTLPPTDIAPARSARSTFSLADRNASTLLPLTAPFDGVVVERNAAPGEVVDVARALYAVADTTRMWVMLDVHERDLRHVDLGQPVVVTVTSLRGESFAGSLTWVSAHVDPRTRTLRARAEVENPDGRLRANMFGSARITVLQHDDVLVVPKGAVQWEGCCNVAFVRVSDVLFEPRKLHLGWESETVFEVLDGLDAGDVVVTTGSFLLKTELLKGSIGAGCCEVDPGR